MPEYKLWYFPLRGRAEFIRFLFAYAEVPFEELNFSREEWPSKYKNDTPFGQVPVLEIDGKKLAQSSTIGRYLAEEFGLRGKSSWQKALADMLVDGVHDAMNAFRPVVIPLFHGDMAKHKEALEVYKNETAKPFLKNFTKLLAENEMKSGWFVGAQLTWADIVVAEYLERVDSCFLPGILDEAPELKAHQAKVYAIPQIAAWVAKRPAYQF